MSVLDFELKFVAKKTLGICKTNFRTQVSGLLHISYVLILV